MSENTASDDHKRRVMANFNTLAAGYDTIRFVQVCARRLIELAELRAGARVLDIATGTGLVAMVAAQIVGPDGRVVGVDIAPEMVAHARRKLASAGLTNVEFREGDAEHLDFPDQSFDVVLCASSLFFMPDMLAALKEWRRVLAPGGYLGFTSFGSAFLQPLRDLWITRLQQYGVPIGLVPVQRLADPAICRQLLDEAGFTQIEVRSELLGYYLRTAEERWEELRTSLEGLPLAQLAPAQREQIEAEHLAELNALVTPEGIWVDVPSNFAFGRQPPAR